MASQPTTVDFLVEQMGSAGTVTARKMFGEYALYCDDRLVALVCEDKLFIKPTTAGKAFHRPGHGSAAVQGSETVLLRVRRTVG